MDLTEEDKLSMAIPGLINTYKDARDSNKIFKLFFSYNFTNLHNFSSLQCSTNLHYIITKLTIILNNNKKENITLCNLIRMAINIELQKKYFPDLTIEQIERLADILKIIESKKFELLKKIRDTTLSHLDFDAYTKTTKHDVLFALIDESFLLIEDALKIINSKYIYADTVILKSMNNLDHELEQIFMSLLNR